MPSSVVAAMKYDAKASKLRVIYTSGNIYDYKEVSEKVYNEMKKASSKGAFLNKQIKPNYDFEKIK
ncbi:MAG: KTSC domain-containing protein [Bacteroidetes bacterium]|nr:MAG: KTSC domain-containing protein [Bacteroidota bacterium]